MKIATLPSTAILVVAAHASAAAKKSGPIIPCIIDVEDPQRSRLCFWIARFCSA